MTKKFIADSKRNTITKDKLEISKIFKWSQRKQHMGNNEDDIAEWQMMDN